MNSPAVNGARKSDPAEFLVMQYLWAWRRTCRCQVITTLTARRTARCGAETHWYPLRSNDNHVQTISWGSASVGHIPVPGDDEDGQAVWRASEGRWHAQRSSDNSSLIDAG
jgi:hypothetical protein